MGGFVDNTVGSARDAVTNTTGSVIDAHHEAFSSALDLAKNTYNSGMAVMQPVLNPLVNAADGLVGAMGLPKDTFKNLQTSTNDAVNNTISAGQEANDTAAKAATGLNKLQDKAMKKAQKTAASGVDRAINDPSGLLKDASDAAIGITLAPAKPVLDAASRESGGSGDFAGDTFGKGASEATTNSMRAGISGVKAAEGVLLAAPTGGLSLTMTGDELSKAAGGSGDIMHDMGANSAFSMGAHIASGVATGMASADPTMGGVGVPDVAANFADPIAQGIVTGAGQNLTMAAAMGANEDQLAKSALTGGAAGAMSAGIGPDPLGNGNVTAADRAANAAVRQSVARGGTTAIQGKGIKEVGKQAAYGALEGGGSSLITDAGGVKTNEKGVEHTYTDGVANKGPDAALLLTQTARGAWQGGVNAEANGNAFAEGARIGMAGGAVGGTAQQAVEAAGGRDVMQAGANRIGTEVGRGVQSLKEQREYTPPLPEFAPTNTATIPDTSARARLGGLLQSGEFDRAGYVSPAILAARAALSAKYNRKGA